MILDSNLNKWALIIISALAFSFSFPPVEIPYLSLVALAPLFLFIYREEKLWRLILGVASFWLLFAALTLSFVFEPFLFFANLLILLGAPACLFLARRVLRQAKHGAETFFFILPFVWTFFEYLQATYAPIPSHIIASGNTLADTLFFPLASLGGLYGLSFIVAGINAGLAFVWWNRRNKNIALLFIISVMALVIFSYLAVFMDTKRARVSEEKIRIVSFSVSRTFFNKISLYEKKFIEQDGFMLREMEEYFNTNLSLLADDNENKKIDLIVLPEWLTEYAVFEGDTDTDAKTKWGITNNGALIVAYRRLSLATETSVLASANTLDENGNLFNSELLFDANGEIIGKYDKTQLVLASEYWPFGDWVPFYWKATLSYSPQPSFIGAHKRQFNKNKTPFSALVLPGGVVFAAPICLEGQIGAAVRAFQKNGAKFLVNDSSQTWISFNAKSYRKMTLNTSRILARQYGIPIILGGRESYAGMIDELGNAQVIFHDQYPQRAFISEL